MNSRFKNFYELALKKWGEESQLRMCIEEMSELIKAICKYIRLTNDSNQRLSEEERSKGRQAILEEIADVLNMAEQLQYIFGEAEVEKIREYKISREEFRLLKEKENSNSNA